MISTTNRQSQLPRTVIRFLIFACLVLYAAILAWCAEVLSPTLNEIGHVPAGICHWRYGLFDLYRVNPPLPRLVAALPVLFCDPETAWPDYQLHAGARSEVPTGIAFARVNGPDTFRLYTIARWACIPFSLIGGLVCYMWAKQLWGQVSGLTALVLWCFSPWILGHGPLVMPDVPGAAMGVTAAYFFWRWMKQPTWDTAAVAGLALGFAELCKFTLLLFYVVWPLLWISYLISRRHGKPTVSIRQQSAMLVSMGAISVGLINAGYGFSGSLKPLGDYEFQSRWLKAQPQDLSSNAKNRLANSWLANVPVPLPKDYVYGIDRLRDEFERGTRCYVRGQWKERGWWWYYLYGLAIKTPLGTLVLVGLAAVLTCFPAYRADWRDELFLFTNGLVLLTFVSLQTGYSVYVRYALPALPFFCIFAAKCGRAFDVGYPRIGKLALACLAWSTASSLWIYPHGISYFNELVGGPRNGHGHLLDSNIAWGQDLLYLRKWLDDHPEAKPLKLASFGWVDPRIAGIEFELPPVGPRTKVDEDAQRIDFGPEPGCYIIDVNFLRGTHWPAATGNGAWRDIPTTPPNYEYFLEFEPVDSVAYSMAVYHLTVEDCNRFRKIESNCYGTLELPSRRLPN